MPQKWIAGFEGLYAVTESGHVWSERTHRWLRPGAGKKHGYLTVALGRGNTRHVHRLVANAFLGPTPIGMEVRHKDGDRANPHVNNLEFGTRSDNNYDAVRHGTWDPYLRRGKNRMWTE